MVDDWQTTHLTKLNSFLIIFFLKALSHPLSPSKSSVWSLCCRNNVSPNFKRSITLTQVSNHKVKTQDSKTQKTMSWDWNIPQPLPYDGGCLSERKKLKSTLKLQMNYFLSWKVSSCRIADPKKKKKTLFLPKRSK
jgi:hypothetical protein